MLIPVLLVVASLVVLYFGADFLVKGSSSLRHAFWNISFSCRFDRGGIRDKRTGVTG